MTPAAETVRRYLHRKGIARVLNMSTDWHGATMTKAYVQTALPLRFLVNFATGWRVRSVRSVTRFGLLEWRWHVSINDSSGAAR